MSKRPADKQASPAAKRVKDNADVMGCIIQAVARENKELRNEVDELKEQNQYLHRQVERLDAYTAELEGRLTTMETLVSDMLRGGSHVVVESYIHTIRQSQEHDMTDLDRLLAEFETDDDTLADDMEEWLNQFER